MEPSPLFTPTQPPAAQPAVVSPSETLLPTMPDPIQNVSITAPAPSVPVTPPEPPKLNTAGDDQPVPVVQVLSVRGVEYTMLTLALWFVAGALIWLLLSIINGDSSYETLSFPASVLIVSLPLFAWLYLRLRKGELANPELRLDPSKRRLSQFTQIIAFAACFFNVIALVYETMQKLGGRFSGSLLKIFLGVLVVFVVAGGILVYYWIDEHRLARQR